MSEKSVESRDVWEQMYRLGLTATRIPEVCNVPVKTVNWTIGRRSRLDASLKTDHAKNADRSAGPPASALTPQWLARPEEFILS